MKNLKISRIKLRTKYMKFIQKSKFSRDNKRIVGIIHVVKDFGMILKGYSIHQK